MSSHRTTLFRQFIVRLAPPLLCTLLLALGANVAVGYHMAYKEQQHRQKILSQAYAQSLVKPLWDCDDKTAQGIMDSMMQTESIDGSILKAACTGQSLRSGAIHSAEESKSFGTTQKLHYYDESGRSFEVGELHICFHPVGVMQSASDAVWFYLTVTTLVALCLVGATLFIFRNLISRPLTLFQKVIKHRGQDTAFTVVVPTGGRNDELTDVLKAYDRLMGTIAAQQDELAARARKDPLTELGNRLYLQECFETMLERVRIFGGVGYVLLFDLDGFKPINDTLGHAAGDAVLIAVARRLQQAVRDGDMVIRLGGDEFVVILRPREQEVNTDEIVARIRAQLGAPLEYEGHSLVVGASIGVASFNAQTTNGDVLLSEADKAMYQDKLERKAGR